MAKPENDVSFPDQQTWGTWEELLLACAVHRHGIESWNSVSAEIQKQSPNIRPLTASACRRKYFDLKQRFTGELALPESVAEISTVPWLEELRRQRVDELRREVEQYDLSISSLQSKVKRLEEEREMSFNKPNTKIENSELENNKKCTGSGEPVPKSPVQLVNESIPQDPKETGPGNAERDEVMAGRCGGESKLAREDSCRGSCESVVKESAANSRRVEPVSGIELIESEGGASRGEEITSDVQSSASLPRKGTSEQDNEDQSPTSAKDFAVESQPLISFVEILLSHPCGSHFSRRLDTQETPEYSKVIREHVDFEIIRKRVEEGYYKSSRSKLFRDLLLMINNARVFYHKGSSEFKSAEQLHQLVKKQMATTTATLERPSKEISPPKEEDVAISSSKPFSSKPRMSVPVIAFRKRSSLAAKPLLLLRPGSEKKSKKTDHVVVADEKPGSEKDDEFSGKDDDSLILKKMTRGRTSLANRNVKNRDSSLNVDDSEGKVKKTDQEKKVNNSNTKGSSKKKSAASFLKRMKVVETLKPSSATDSSTTEKGRTEHRKNNSNKTDAKKQPVTGKKQTNEKASPVKKNNGRASEREAAPSSPSSPILAKRSREAGEKEAASSSSTSLKKRARR